MFMCPLGSSLFAVNRGLNAFMAGVFISLVFLPEKGRAQTAFRLPQNAADLVLDVISQKKMARKSLRAQKQQTRDYHGLALNSWIIYPSLLMGGIYNDNLYRTTSNRQSGFGLRVVPQLVAERDTGIHRTTVFAYGNFSLYQKSTADMINAQVGFSHNWRPVYDTQFKVYVNAGHIETGFNTGYLIQPGTGEILGYQLGSSRMNLLSGGVSGIKSFDHVFVGGGVTTDTFLYDSLNTSRGSVAQSYRDNVRTTFFVNAGYMITPLLYAFSEISGNVRQFLNGSFYDSQGYRIVAGLGSDRISLFRGEVYGGYQRQIYNNAIFGAPASPVLGGRIYWYPTRAWVVTASLDETFLDFAQPTVGNITGSAALATAAKVSAKYAFSKRWSASINGGYTDYRYIKGTRNDHYWLAGAALHYELMRNLEATFEYSFVQVLSNAPRVPYVNSIYMLGAAYKY